MFWRRKTNRSLFISLAVFVFLILFLPLNFSFNPLGIKLQEVRADFTGWTKKVEIRIDHTKVSGTNNEFPVLLTADNFPATMFTTAKADACDLRFSSDSDGTTEIPFELVSYTASPDTIEVWVKANVNDATDASIWAWYGNASASCYAVGDAYGGRNVWDSNYTMVHHFNGAAYTNLDDSTASANDVSGVAGAPLYNQAGAFGASKSVYLGGAAVFTTGAAHGLAGNFNGTIEAWVDPDAANAYGVPWVGGTASPGGSFSLFLGNDASVWIAYNAGVNWISTIPAYATGWQHIQTTKNAGAINTTSFVYRNGVALTQSTAATSTPNYVQNVSYIGQWTNAGYKYAGYIDELRISKTNRSQGWSITSYNNQSAPATFAIEQAEEDAFPSNTTPASPTSPLQYKTDGITLIANGDFSNETSVKFKASATDADTSEVLTLFFESALSAGAFNSPATPTTGTSCASGTEWSSCASKIWYVTSASGDYSATPYTGTTSVAGLADESYKWQVKACDDEDACSAWVAYNVTTPNFTVDSSTPDVVAVDAGASSLDRTSLSSDAWFNYANTGNDDQISFSWTDPSSVSDDTFYYELNSDSGDTISGDESTTANPYIDDITISEGTSYFHVRPKTGAGTWGTERTFTVKYDKTAPAGGSVSYANGYASSPISLTVDDGTDSGADINIATRQAQRKEADLAGGICGAYGIWGNITPDGVYPDFTDNTVASGKCYQYQYLVSDNISNQATYTNTNEVKIDSFIPDIIAVDAGASNADRTGLTSAAWFNYANTGNDDQISFSWTDPASVSDDTFYYELNASSGDTITGDESTTSNPYIDDITISEGTNYFHVRPKTGAGTWGTERTFTVKYDKTNPSISIDSITETSDYLYTSGSTIYTNNAVAVPGSFTINITASDAISDINQVSGETAFGDTPTDNSSLFELTYSVEQGSSSDGTITITAADNAGNTNTADVAHINDLTAPINISVASVSADSATQLTANADTATDADSGLNTSPYWFEETTGGAGGSSSVAWQAGTAFADNGLSPNIQYSYKVKARDNVGNESAYSAVSSKYTLANVPNNLTGTADSQTQITISWEANSNPAGTQYYAENTTAGTNSGWIAVLTWPSAILTCGTSYSFQVKARNGDLEETTAVTLLSVTTSACTVAEEDDDDDDDDDDHKKKKTTASAVVQTVRRYLGLGEEEAPEIPIVEVTVPEATPLVFQGNWNLLPEENINRFALQNLPANFQLAISKFPQLQETFASLGVEKAADVAKLTSAKLEVPSLNAVAGLPQGNTIALGGLSKEEKETIPAEVVFVRTAGGLVDVSSYFKLDASGNLQQEFNTIIGKPMQLLVRLDSPARDVNGYVVFNSASTEEVPNFSSVPSRKMFSFLGNTAFAQSDISSEKERMLVLQKFQYSEPEKDGIYEAEITAPLASGKYKIVTNIDYEDVKLASKTVEMMTVIDPEGYIFEKIGEGELHIPNATISIFWLDLSDNQYKLWPADKFMQKNPQTTDKKGTYSFLVPKGKYFLKAEAPGYLPYESEKFEAAEGNGIHQNIEMKKRYGWFSFDNWEHIILIIVTVALVIVTILLMYNFYQDKLRAKIIKKVKK